MKEPHRAPARPRAGGHVGRHLPRDRRAHAARARRISSGAPPPSRSTTRTTRSRVVKRVMERNKLNVKQFTPRGVHAAISDAKNALVTPDEYANLAMDPFSRAVAVVYRDLGEALRVANAVDFDDLLVLPVRLLAENPGELEKYRRQVPVPARRRVPGHEPRAVPVREAARRRARQPLRRRRRRSVDLRLARRRHPQHPRLQQGLPRRRTSCGSRRTIAAPPRSSISRTS